MPFTADLPPNNKQVYKTHIQINRYENDSTNISDINTLKLDRDLMEDIYLSGKFDALVKNWKQNSMFQSSISKIIEDENFQEIISMGERAIPLIIDEVERNPSLLVWALNIIQDKTVESRQRLTVTQACQKWVKDFHTGKIKLKSN